MPIFTEGRKTNPASGTVLADTGPRDGPAESNFKFIISASVTATVRLQRRNAANDGTVFEQYVDCGPGALVPPLELLLPFDDQERVRIITDGLLVGAIQATINQG